MILSDISVRRPVFATVLSLLLVLLGAAALPFNFAERDLSQNRAIRRLGEELLESAGADALLFVDGVLFSSLRNRRSKSRRLMPMRCASSVTVMDWPTPASMRLSARCTGGE